MVQRRRRRDAPFATGELRRVASSRRNEKTEAFRDGEGVKASRIQDEINVPVGNAGIAVSTLIDNCSI